MAEESLGEAPTRRIISAVSPTPYPTATPPPSVRPEELAKMAASLRLNMDTVSKHAEEGLASSLARLNAMDNEIAALSKAQLEQGAEPADERKGLGALTDAMEANQKKSEDSLKKVQDISDDLQRKGERMESVLDLMNTLKRDVNDNAHEIADIKSELEKIEERTRVKSDNSDWWDQVVSWHYLPLTAVILGAVAIGVAASQK